MALGEMNSGNESACELKRLSDTRNTATKPSDYYGKFVLTGIKHCTALGLPSSGSTGYGFYNVIGFDGWDDGSGPRAIEIAFGCGNGIYILGVLSKLALKMPNYRIVGIKLIPQRYKGGVNYGFRKYEYWCR